MRKLYLLVIMALALGLSSVAFAADDEVTIELNEQNDSGVSGSATLRDMGNGKTEVTLKLEGATGGHPAHIHEGTCETLNPEPALALQSVDENGESTTEVDASLETIMSKQHAINVHKGATPEEVKVYIACGDIPVTAGVPDTGAGGMSQSGSAPMVGLGLVGLVLAAGSLLVARSRSI